MASHSCCKYVNLLFHHIKRLIEIWYLWRSLEFSEWRLIRPGSVSVVSFWWAVWNVASVPCSELTGVASMVLCAVHSEMVLCTPWLEWKSFSADVIFLSFQIGLPILLWYQHDIFIHTTATHYTFSLFRPSLCKPCGWLFVKISAAQEFHWGSNTSFKVP